MLRRWWDNDAVSSSLATASKRMYGMWECLCLFVCASARTHCVRVCVLWTIHLLNLRVGTITFILRHSSTFSSGGSGTPMHTICLVVKRQPEREHAVAAAHHACAFTEWVARKWWWERARARVDTIECARPEQRENACHWINVSTMRRRQGGGRVELRRVGASWVMGLVVFCPSCCCFMCGWIIVVWYMYYLGQYCNI